MEGTADNHPFGADSEISTSVDQSFSLWCCGSGNASCYRIVLPVWWDWTQGSWGKVTVDSHCHLAATLVLLCPAVPYGDRRSSFSIQRSRACSRGIWRQRSESVTLNHRLPGHLWSGSLCGRHRYFRLYVVWLLVFVFHRCNREYLGIQQFHEIQTWFFVGGVLGSEIGCSLTLCEWGRWTQHLHSVTLMAGLLRGYHQ